MTFTITESPPTTLISETSRPATYRKRTLRNWLAGAGAGTELRATANCQFSVRAKTLRQLSWIVACRRRQAMTSNPSLTNSRGGRLGVLRFSSRPSVTTYLRPSQRWAGHPFTNFQMMSTAMTIDKHFGSDDLESHRISTRSLTQNEVTTMSILAQNSPWKKIRKVVQHRQTRVGLQMDSDHLSLLENQNTLQRTGSFEKAGRTKFSLDSQNVGIRATNQDDPTNPFPDEIRS